MLRPDAASWHFHGLLAFHDSLQFHRALDPNQPLLVKFHRMPVQERLLVQCPSVICSAWWPRLYKCQTKIAWPSWPLFMTASLSMSFCRLAKIISCRTSKRPSVALCGSTQRNKKVTQRNKTSMVSEANRTAGKLRQRRRKEQGWPSIANNCQAVVSSAKKCQEVPASLPSQPASPSVLPSAASAGFQLGFQLGFQCVHGSPAQHANCLCFIKASTPTLGGSRRLKKLRT